jgi:hypothetical protein
VDRSSPLLDFNKHVLDDLLPYVLCCRSGSMSPCGEYERLRPSILRSAQAYEIPVPGNPPSTYMQQPCSVSNAVVASPACMGS